MIDQERFHNLLVEAIHGRTQKEFAELAGMSRYTLNRYLTDGISNAPRLSTLQGIADASEGRVSLRELEYSVGIYTEPKQENSLNAPEHIRKRAEDLMLQVKSYISSPAKHSSERDLIDLVDKLYLESGDSICEQDPHDFIYVPSLSNPYRGAELVLPVEAALRDGEETWNFLFAVLYCRTTGTENNAGGIIALDSAWTLQEISVLLPEESLGMLRRIATVDKAKYTDYPLCLWKEKKEE